MNRINGLAAPEAISTYIGMRLIYSIENTEEEPLYLMIIISATAGAEAFLYWNFPKAKLFMGDASSLFLGLGLGLLAIKKSGRK